MSVFPEFIYPGTPSNLQSLRTSSCPPQKKSAGDSVASPSGWTGLEHCGMGHKTSANPLQKSRLPFLHAALKEFRRSRLKTLGKKRWRFLCNGQGETLMGLYQTARWFHVPCSLGVYGCCDVLRNCPPPPFSKWKTCQSGHPSSKSFIITKSHKHDVTCACWSQII